MIRQGAADEELGKLLAEAGAGAIFLIAIPTPLAGKWRKRSRPWLNQLGVSVHPVQDIAIHERDEILTGKGEPYRVFTPYSRAWRKLPKPPVHGAPRRVRTPAGIGSLPLPTLGTWRLEASAEIIAPG